MARTFAIAEQYELAFNQRQEEDMSGAALVAECCEVDSGEASTSGYVQEPSRREEARLDPRLKVWWPSSSQPQVYVQQQMAPSNQSTASDVFYYQTAGGVLRPEIRVVGRSMAPSTHTRIIHPYAVKSPMVSQFNGHGYTASFRRQQPTVVVRQRPVVVVNNRSLRLSEQSRYRVNDYNEQRTSMFDFRRSHSTMFAAESSRTLDSHKSARGPTDSAWKNTDHSVVAVNGSRPLTKFVSARPPPKSPSPPPPPPPAWYERDAETLWRLVFAQLPRKTLSLQCALVCRAWSGWISDWPALWDDIDVNGRQQLSAHVWKSIGQKRPRFLNLGWTGISSADLLTILEYDDRLDTLALSGCHFSAVTSLRRCTSDLVRLDLRYVQGCTDASFKELVLNAPRMKTLQAVFLSGCDVGDATVRLMANQFTRLRSLDLSYCTRVTNLSVEVLGAAGCAARRNLTYLNLSGCPLLLSSIFGPLQRMNALKHLELQACTGIPQLEIEQFEQAYAVTGRTITVIR